MPEVTTVFFDLGGVLLTNGWDRNLSAGAPDHPALQITQRKPGECVFIDDRDLNLECAATEGMHTIHYHDPSQLRRELAGLRINPGE